MSNQEEMKDVKLQHSSAAVTADDAVVSEVYAARNLTFRENVVLTIKLLVGAGLIGAALLGFDLWTAAK